MICTPLSVGSAARRCIVVLACAPLALAATAVGAFTAQSAKGKLDRSFDRDGRAIVDLGSGVDKAQALVLQPDGKLIIGGFGAGGLHLARIKSNGKLDRSFAGDGHQSTRFPERAGAIDLALDGQGRIMALGSPGFVLARFHRDGSPDTTFASAGRLADTAKLSVASALAIQRDGKIVVAGSERTSENVGSRDSRLSRYNADGSPDASFSGDGKVLTALSPRDDRAADVVVQRDGKIVTPANTEGGVAFTRFMPDGSLDRSFGSNGVRTLGGGLGAREAVLQPDGKIVVGVVGSGSFRVARFRSDGSLDSSFGRGGLASVRMGRSATVSNLALQADGKIVAVGTSDSSPAYGGGAKFAIARFTRAGRLDRSFSRDGRELTRFPRYEDAFAHSVALSANGRILVVGRVRRLDANAAIVRYR